MKNTLVVNLFGGPGTGKSTGATYLFSKLKMAGIDAEYVSEFAKDKVWEHNGKVFECQMYITGKQLWKIQRCLGEVDVVITDSPLLQGTFYLEDGNPLRETIIYETKKMRNLNIMLKRVKEYNPNGRNQTETEARNMDSKIEDILDNADVYLKFNADKEGYDQVYDTIITCLNGGK